MIRCAIVGATGLVGRTFLKVLEERKLKIDEYKLFASKKSKGKKIKFMDEDYIVDELNEDSFSNTHFDYALFSAGGNISSIFSPIAAKNKTIVIDNSSYFRMFKDVPLVVPEINKNEITKNNGIIANPNCSTIQAVLILNTLNKLYKIKRVVFSTYQAVSGAGINGIKDLENMCLDSSKLLKFNYPIYNNCLPQIDDFTSNGYTKEELKMINETRKILNIPGLNITATCVRVPVKNCHCESINVEFYEKCDLDEIKQELNKQNGIVVLDDIERNIYPIPTFVDGKDDVFVGRIRYDESVNSGINFFCVADNIRKGAATNAVQILEELLKLRNEQ